MLAKACETERGYATLGSYVIEFLSRTSRKLEIDLRCASHLQCAIRTIKVVMWNRTLFLL
jgi:hypothetical protein